MCILDSLWCCIMSLLRRLQGFSVHVPTLFRVMLYTQGTQHTNDSTPRTITDRDMLWKIFLPRTTAAHLVLVRCCRTIRTWTWPFSANYLRDGWKREKRTRARTSKSQNTQAQDFNDRRERDKGTHTHVPVRANPKIHKHKLFAINEREKETYVCSYKKNNTVNKAE